MYEIYVSRLYLLLGKVFLQDTAGKMSLSEGTFANPKDRNSLLY